MLATQQDPAMHEILRVRKMLIWAIPFFLGFSAFCVWFIWVDLIPTIERLRDQAPVIRLRSMGLLVPVVVLLGPVTVVALVMKALPVALRLQKKMERLINVMVFISGGVMVLIALSSTLLQSHYMPKLGYSRCTLLRDNPTIWFSDWVRDPAWCQRGKTLEWVDAQARSAGPTR
jgi:hypothetical protein